MSAIPFTRSLGRRSGVQLNQRRDDSERFVPGEEARAFGGVGRFTRGRIDRAFPVSRDRMTRLLGAPVSPQVSALNEAMVHVYEAFSLGAQRAIISRLAPTGASLKWMVASLPAAQNDPVWTISATEAAPSVSYLLAVRHLECFNEGVRAEISARAAVDAEGDPAPSKWVTLRLIDLNGTELFSFSGSLDPAAKDEFNESTYLPSIVSAQTDDVEVVVIANAAVPITAPFYGLDENSRQKVSGGNLVYFSEGGTNYSAQDIDRAVSALKKTIYPFGMIAGLGTSAAALISKLAPLAVEINKPLVLDIPGGLSVTSAITFANQFNLDTDYVHWYWSPLKAADPLNGGKLVFGVSGAQVGLRCQRNANTDANGVPPMQYPIAGKDWQLQRTGIVQIADLEDDDLESLAEARINPVIFQSYNDGGRYVFYDSLTAAKTEGDRKLVAVSEMSTQVDNWVTGQAKEYLQKPMSEAVTKMTRYLQTLFEGIETAGWLVPSDELEGASFVAVVRPNAQRPKDRMDVTYWLSYEGTVRAIYVSQTISK